MQINNSGNNKVHPKGNTYRSLSPITRILKLFSLDCNVQKATKTSLAITKCIISAIVFGSFIVYSLYFKAKFIYSNINISIKLTDSVQMIYDFFQYIVDLYFVYKYGRHISLEYFKQYDAIDKILNVTCYAAIERKLLKLVGFFFGLWMISSSFDFAAWVLGYGWLIPLIYAVAYVYFFIKIVTTLDLTGHVIHIEVRLRIIGDLVQNFYSSADCSPLMIGDTICNSNWLYSDACSRTLKIRSREHPFKSSDNDYHEVKRLTRCYLLITEQVVFINRMYGLRILLNSLSFLIDMVRFTNIAVRIIIGSQHTTYDSGYFPAVSSLMRLIACVAVIVSLVDHCENTYRQRDRIISIIDHLLVNKHPSVKLAEAMTELRGLAKERPIYFNMANFFQLNYPLLMSIASIVVTYTIILLQSEK